MEMAIGNFVTTQEAADILGVTDIRVRQIVQDGRLTRHNAGRMILLDKREVQEFAKEDRPAGRPKKSSNSRR
jgi:excisionase family DNA binding protein